MNLQIITPEKTIFEGQVEMVRVPGTLGLFQMLKNHEPIISTLEKGQIKVRNMQGEYKEFNITGGYVKCINNEITILLQEY